MRFSVDDTMNTRDKFVTLSFVFNVRSSAHVQFYSTRSCFILVHENTDICYVLQALAVRTQCVYKRRVPAVCAHSVSSPCAPGVCSGLLVCTTPQCVLQCSIGVHKWCVLSVCCAIVYYQCVLQYIDASECYSHLFR